MHHSFNKTLFLDIEKPKFETANLEMAKGITVLAGKR